MVTAVAMASSSAQTDAGYARLRQGALARTEEGIVAEATRALDASLAVIAAMLRARAPVWRRDPELARRERKVLARRLRDLRPGVGLILAGQLAAAGLTSDRAVKDTIKRVDALVRAKARVVAGLVERAPINTDRQVQVLARRIMTVGSPAEAAASVVVVRTVEIAARAQQAGMRRVWVTAVGCCVHCAERSGATAAPGQRFGKRVHLTNRPLPWAVGEVDGPPLHNHCRCIVVPETPGLADALAKATAAEAASGKLGHMSSTQRARVARRVLAARAPLNSAATRRARRLATGTRR